MVLMNCGTFVAFLAKHGNHVAIVAIPQSQKETIPAVWNRKSRPKIEACVIQVDCYQGFCKYVAKFLSAETFCR